MKGGFVMRTLFCLLFLILGANNPVFSADWPQYRGPLRNDVSEEKGLLKQWPADGPGLLWTYDNAGIGYSGPAIIGDWLCTLGARGDSEYLIALNLRDVKNQTIKEIWATKVGPKFDWEGNRWSAGPSATPTVEGGLVFALGGNGHLVCVEGTTGKERWRKDLPAELDAQVNPIGGGPKKLGWGFTSAPLVDGEQLICVLGGPKGTVAALNKRTGAVLWRSTELTDQAAYTSPMIAEFAGVRQYVVLTNRGLYGVDAKSGRLLWSFQREQPYRTEVVNSPIIQGNLIFVTVGAGHGCDLVRVVKDGARFKAESVYSNKNMANHHGNVVLTGGHLYGFSEGRGWVCQEFKSGEIMWAEKKLRPGSLTCADGRLYCYDENDGTTVLIEASTSGWKESGRFRIPQQSKLKKPGGHIWTPPVVAGGRLFLRDQEFVFCYDVRSKTR